MPSDQGESRTVFEQTGAPEWAGPALSIVGVSSHEDEQFAQDQLHASQFARDEFGIDQFAQNQFADEQFTDQLASEQLVDEALHTDELVAPDTEGDLLHWAGHPPLISKETLGTFWRQFAPVLAPLPCGLLIFLATLPATLSGTYIPVWGMAIVMLVLMVLQGTLLYFAGSNDTLLALYLVAGYTLFIVAGVFAAFGIIPALLTLSVLLIAGVVLARRGLHPTRVGHVDIVTSFGKYSQTLEPGLNLLLPWEHVECGLSILETTWTTPKMEVPTARDQKVELIATISYQLMPEDAYLAATSAKNWESSSRDLFCGTVQSVVNGLKMEDFVAWSQSIYSQPAHDNDASSFNPAAATRWDRINNTLRRKMQDQVAAWGVQVNWVRIQDLTPLPISTGHAAILHLNGDSGGSTQIMKHEIPLASSTSQRVAKADVAPTLVQPPTLAPAPSATPSTPKALPAGKLPRVETLVDTYDAVRQNLITDPKLILDLAQHFEVLASDPVASKHIEFDASRAADTLRQRAQKVQEINNNK